MRVAVEKMEGVTSAEVSLNEGEVVVSLEEDNHVRLDRLRQVIRDQGFTPREAEIRARGVIERRGDRLWFRTPEGEIVLEVDGEPDTMASMERSIGEWTVIEGRIEPEAPRRMWVTSLS